MKLPTKEEARAKFWELVAQEKAIRARSAPLREKRDAWTNEIREQERAMNAEIHKAEAGLFDIVQLKSQMAALAGNVGSDPSLSE
jgi:hypothetical protein